MVTCDRLLSSGYLSLHSVHRLPTVTCKLDLVVVTRGVSCLVGVETEETSGATSYLQHLGGRVTLTEGYF